MTVLHFLIKNISSYLSKIKNDNRYSFFNIFRYCLNFFINYSRLSIFKFYHSLAYRSFIYMFRHINLSDKEIHAIYHDYFFKNGYLKTIFLIIELFLLKLTTITDFNLELFLKKEFNEIYNIFSESYWNIYKTFSEEPKNNNKNNNIKMKLNKVSFWNFDIKLISSGKNFSPIYFYNIFKSLFIPLIVSSLIVILLLDYFYIDVLTHAGIWTVVGFLFFWLFSGFNFFLKRYRFGKFTSALQRFWKRTNAYFWLIEGFLFSLFFYYYLNSSQEPLYMYDESSLNQTYLTNLPSTYFSFILVIFMIFYSYYLLLNIVNLNFKQKLTHLTIITIFLFFIFLLESYQFYYIITVFFENMWSYDIENNLWVLNYESPRIRVKQQYLILAMIAKYWHFLFIFFSWLFLVFKVYEQKKIYYPLFGVNLQNFILLFCLNILFSLSWLKWLIRRYYDIIYFWFFTDSNNWSINTFNSELLNIFL
jgi:hypothetical protein